MLKSLVCLAAALACCTTVLAEIPTGCVTIKNKYSDKFLTTTTRYNSDRRYVKQSATSQEWNIVKENGYFRIVHKNHGEGMFASGINFSDQERYAFTWVNRADGDQGKWDIVATARADGQVLIRSLQYNEHLYAADFDDYVFLWMPTDPINGNDRFYWIVTKC